MLPRDLLDTILRDESLTRGLGDAEAQLLIEWLVDWAELLIGSMEHEAEARLQIERIRLRARAVARYVSLWSVPGSRGAAYQLAAAERFPWSPPSSLTDSFSLMQRILSLEDASPARRAA